MHCCVAPVVIGTLKADWTVMLFELELGLKEVALAWSVSQTAFCKLRDEEGESASMVCPRVAVLPETWN